MPGTAPTAASEAMLMMWPLPPLHHSLGGELGAEDDAEDVDGDRALSDLVGLVEEAARWGDARVVDQDVDGSEFSFDVVEECR